MKIKLLNGTMIENIDFAAVNTIDGRLTIGISRANDFYDVYKILSNSNNTSEIKCLSDDNVVSNVFSGYNNLSLFSVNSGAGNMTFWLSKNNLGE